MISAVTKTQRYVRTALAVLAMLAFLLSVETAAQPVFSNVTHTVTTLVDELDANILPITGAGTSLREAVAYSGAGDRILFAPGLTGSIFLTLGEIPVSHDLFITGPGLDILEVNGNDLSRIFTIPSGVSVEISALTLASGRAVDGGAIHSSGWLAVLSSAIRWSTAIQRGGALYHDGTALILSQSRFENCDAYMHGGAIALTAGSVSVDQSRFSGNTSGGDGGALYLAVGSSTMDVSTCEGNTAVGSGGALSIGGAATLTITSSTFNDNRAFNGGGMNNEGTVTLTNSTVSGNTADGNGGGIRSLTFLSTDFCTVAFNSAGQGGGVYASGSFTPKRSIFAENTGSVGPDVRFNANSAGWNLIGIAGPTSGWTPTDLVGTASDPMNAALDELRLNGGVTKSHALLVCSRAIDAADPTGTAAMTDQRGVGRNINGNNDNVALPDIGAYERTTSLDNTPPTINPHPALRVFLDATGNATIAKDDVLLSAFDNCDILNTTVSKTSFSCADVGTVTLTLTATDRSFNVRTVNVDVEVIDDTPPALTPPANLAVDASSVNCGITLTSAQLGSPTTSDACGSVTVTNNAPGSLFFPVGQTLLTWFATDVNGNISTAMQTVTVNDNSNPVVIAPADITINTGADQCAVPLTDVSLGSPTVTDNCTTTIDHDAPASFPIGTTTVTWTATDASGNSGSASQSVTVIDATPPVLFAPQDLVLAAEINSCSRDGATIDLGTPTFSDNCTGVTVSNDKPANFPIGETIVTWTALDNVGNSTTVQQKVTVFDSNPPSVVAPPNIEVEVDQGTCAWTVDPNVLGTATSNDNCSVPSVANSAGTSLSAGTHRVIWTAIDANGNRATDVQIVTVVGEPPTIECPTPLPQYSTDAGRAGAVVTYGLPTVSSGCSDVEIIRTGGLGSGDFFPVGTTTVTYMAIDASNQIDICEFDVIVVDNEPPQISVHIAPVYLWPANNQMEEVKVTVDLWDNVPGTTAKLTKIESNQNINGDVLDASIGDFDLFFNLRAKNVQGPRTYTITYEATDAAGNKTSASADVTVPTQKPKDFESEDLPVPASVTLAQNYPNPFNPSTLISFGTPEEQHLELRVYNAMGMPVRTLVNTVLDAGQYTVEWDGRDDNGQPLSSGVYLYMLRSGSAHVERKMILAR